MRDDWDPGMNILPSSYCGDDKMEKLIEEAGSELSIFGLYGLILGCLAAPNLVKPSILMSDIFEEEGADFETEEQAKEVMGNIMALWNLLSGWDMGRDGIPVPAFEYPVDKGGVVQRILDDLELVESFLEGLDLGGADIDDPVVIPKEDAESISRVMDIFYDYLEMAEDGNEMTQEQVDEAMKAISNGEMVIDARIENIYASLEEARILHAQDMRAVDAALKKSGILLAQGIGRNEPCPCGSGKKYKKCCGVIH